MTEVSIVVNPVTLYKQLTLTVTKCIVMTTINIYLIVITVITLCIYSLSH